MQSPPAQPFAKRLSAAIIELTNRRDTDFTRIFQDSAPENRNDLIDARMQEWESEVFRACSDMFSHADNLVEIVRKTAAGIREMQEAGRGLYPESRPGADERRTTGGSTR